MAPKIHKPAAFLHHGFTLIELIISIAIIMLLVGGVVASYNSFNTTQLLTQTGLSLKNNLQLMRVKATAVEKPTSGCTQFLGYRITFAASSYSMQPLCTEGLVGVAQTINLPQGVSFSPVPSVVTFAALSGGLTGGATVNLTLIAQSSSYLVQVSSNGTIIDEGLQ